MKRILLFMVAVSLLFGFNMADSKKLVLDGSTTVGPIAKAFAEYFMRKDPSINIAVSESGSGNGAKSLINNACDVANLSRPMKLKEVKAAVEKDIEPCPHVIALDGIAIVVHPSNRVKELTIEKVRDIYLGKITNWKDVGGPNKTIVVVSLDTNSGTFETFEKLVMKKEKVTQKAETVGSNGAVRARVQKTQAAIGYIGAGFIDRTVKPLVINGVKCNVQNIQSGVYPIARPLYMYTNKYPKLGSLKFQFVTFHLSKEGQKIIQEVGFVPVTRY